MEQFVFEIPENMSSLTGCLKNADERTFLLSGGTDLVIKLRKQGVYSGTIIDMSGIKELKYISVDEDHLKIGANTTFAEISENPLVRQYAACIAEAAEQVGSQQIRNAARMAGNVANSSPRGDSIPALFALDAKVKILNGEGSVVYKKIGELVIGIGKNTLKKDEAIIEFLIPLREGSFKSTFGKFGRECHRTTVVISNINIAAVIKRARQSGLVETARVVIGSAAPVPYRAEKAERILIGSIPGPTLRNEFVEALQKHVAESIHGNKRYENKIDGIAGLGFSIYDRLFGNASGGGER